MPEGARLNARAPVAAVGGKPTHCEACNYDLAGSRFGDACPECGRVVGPAIFGGRWTNVRVRRRFGASARLMAVGAVLLVLGVGGMELSSRVASARVSLLVAQPSVIAYIASQIVLPVAMFLLAWSAANDRHWQWLAAGACVRLVQPVYLVGSILGISLFFPTAWLVFVAVVACDGVFAVCVQRFARGTAVPPQPRARAIGLASVAALALLLWMRADFSRGGLPGMATTSYALLVAWSAVEVVLLARRMRAMERA